MTASGIALRRLAAQGIAAVRCDQPADVVRRLSAVQAQDYGQSLWAIGSRLRRGTVAEPRLPRPAAELRARRQRGAVRAAVVLCTRDLRVHDHPALAAAVAAAERVVPLFVFDRAVPARLQELRNTRE